jgi:hypothetical protein
MYLPRFFFSLCLAFFLISACVSKEKYEELEATLAATQAVTASIGQWHPTKRKKAGIRTAELKLFWLPSAKQQVDTCQPHIEQRIVSY